MSILVNKNSRVVVQGITGSAGSFHTKQCMEYGTQVVAGVTPYRGGTVFEAEGPVGNRLQVPLFDTVIDAVRATGADTSVIFVPAAGAADAILEAADAGYALVVCITEGIPVLDMIRVKGTLENSKTRLIGPNCPGIITPGQCKVGIMPGHIHLAGRIGGLLPDRSVALADPISGRTNAGVGS